MTTVQEHDMDIQQSWQAVQTRDRRFDGRFVYAVKSTGVYCNPSCPSRRPQPEQVRFFIGPAEAQSAGFRACRRCLPDRPAGESDRSALVQRACNYIDQAIRDQAVGEKSQVAGRESMEIRSGGLPTVSDICLAVGVTPSRLRRAFKAEAGLTPGNTPTPRGWSGSRAWSGTQMTWPPQCTTPGTVRPAGCTKTRGLTWA